MHSDNGNKTETSQKINCILNGNFSQPFKIKIQGSRLKTGLHTIESDDEEEIEKNEKKINYKKLDMNTVKGLEEDPEDDADEEGNMITGFNLKYVSYIK